MKPFKVNPLAFVCGLGTTAMLGSVFPEGLLAAVAPSAAMGAALGIVQWVVLTAILTYLFQLFITAMEGRKSGKAEITA